MIRPLSRCIHIRVIWRLQHEICAAVLQREAAALGDDSRPEAGVVAVDEGASVSFCVRDGEVYGVAVRVGGRR